MLLFSLYPPVDPRLFPGELLAISGLGGVFIAGDRLTNQFDDFTSAADVLLLSQYKTKSRETKRNEPKRNEQNATKPKRQIIAGPETT